MRSGWMNFSCELTENFFIAHHSSFRGAKLSYLGKANPGVYSRRQRAQPWEDLTGNVNRGTSERVAVTNAGTVCFCHWRGTIHGFRQANYGGCRLAFRAGPSIGNHSVQPITAPSKDAITTTDDDKRTYVQATRWDSRGNKPICGMLTSTRPI
ncbi:hypothetical protein PAAG_00796 [Paracoccidioides lutzii Pb01]|uniref:Uncharacterized protein n=1 Tax=Paracoccidioides lutzii (strain ATCC MYA-826 / Pb01) TaxID=502779 RepID=C1GQK1_PARBA|nr:hypothetical protein PAAG_00796 [Paracoccidioides lutzii Pb01]EEH37875.2 hypothetical protein PAAG_00796 [Paracoccidioides lutzii Pb01]